ncbi:MAG: PIN domain-containing protein [Betaproteobacteria bacterium]|nr:PIN domain-containing protein [Betaproteobacteria bacterium]
MIVDANAWHKFLAIANADAKPVRQWLDRQGGKIAYSEETFQEVPTSAQRQLRAYKQAGKARLVQPEEITGYINKSGKYARQRETAKSNDLPILDLAACIAKGRGRDCVALWTEDDDLVADFKSMKLGRVYAGKQHKKYVLGQTKCA